MSRQKIEEFDRRFRHHHVAICDLARSAGDDRIYASDQNTQPSLAPRSVGTYLIRSAAAVEQMINGITVRLWDDPFEWTLPERLPTLEDLISYFAEVEAARFRGFKFLKNDDELQRSIPAPVELKTLEQILFDTLARSGQYLSLAESMNSPETT